MRIAAMGAGGVGGYFGARLQQAGHEVAFFARGKHFAALKEKGLTLKSPLGAAQLAVQVFSRSEEHTSELQSQSNLVCRLLLEKKKKIKEKISANQKLTSTVPALTGKLDARLAIYLVKSLESITR